MGRQIRVGKHIFLSVLFLGQLFCFPALESVRVAGAEENNIALTSSEVQLEQPGNEQATQIQVAQNVQQGTQVSPQTLANSGMKVTGYIELEDPFRTDIPELKDPFVTYNRFMYRVNDSIYENIMNPIARRYRDWVNEDVRISIKNVFDNATSPSKFVSSVLQYNPDKAARAFGRFVINSTIGVGGLFDVADKHFHIKNVDEDFGQALGYNHIPSGPYFVIPFLGPSTIRDAVGRGVDMFLTPWTFFAPVAATMGAGTGEKINDTSFIINEKKELDDSAVDKYESVRDFYHQYREEQIRK